MNSNEADGGAAVTLMLSLIAFLYELIIAGHSMLVQIKLDRRRSID
jgi:hypothetical protein